MNQKLPPDAFDAYVALGQQRSYSALAAHYGVDKKTVLRRAKDENWQERLVAIEQQARRASDQKLAETIEQMNDRHMKTLRVIQSKAIQALSSMPLTGAMDAVRALDIAIRSERLIRGEPTDRNAVDFAQIAKREHENWMLRPGESDEDDPAPSATEGSTSTSEALPVLPTDGGSPIPSVRDPDEEEDDDADD